MDTITVRSTGPLSGIIKVSGAKNACLPIMAASILSKRGMTLRNVPKLSDVGTMKQLLAGHGVVISAIDENDSFTIHFDSSAVNCFVAPYEVVSRMRASILVLGPLLARYGEAIVSLPGGCAIGGRQVDLHMESMRALGAEIGLENGYIVATAKQGLTGGNYVFPRKSVGATINAIMAATLANGESNFYGCAVEPEIVDLCNCLSQMGAELQGVGTEHVIVNGIDALGSVDYNVIPDRIEAGTYMIASAITCGDITVEGIKPELVGSLTSALKSAGIEVLEADNSITVRAVRRLNAVNISTAPFPGFATDLQAQFMSLMTVASGDSVIKENIFENRYMHVPELCRMGADITINDRIAIVRGVDSLYGAEVMASDLRASVSLVLAGLVAKGETKIHRVYHLDRGYQAIEKKLSNCGAYIRRNSAY